MDSFISGKNVVVLVDSVCHRPVREFINVGEKVNALTFSSDGKWLLVADNECYIRVCFQFQIFLRITHLMGYLKVRAFEFSNASA